MDIITISKEQYDYLIERDAKLSALENHGVDNWSGYSDAMTELDEWNEE